MTQFTRDTLELAQSFIPLPVEIVTHDEDGCVLAIGTYARIDCPEGFGRPYRLSLDPMPGYSWPFANLESACHAAYLLESSFRTVRDASTLGKELVA